MMDWCFVGMFHINLLENQLNEVQLKNELQIDTFELKRLNSAHLLRPSKNQSNLNQLCFFLCSKYIKSWKNAKNKIN